MKYLLYAIEWKDGGLVKIQHPYEKDKLIILTFQCAEDAWVEFENAKHSKYKKVVTLGN